MNILIFVLCLVISNFANHIVQGFQNTLNEDLELERQLKLLNKSPIKSIYTKFGYIVDCIDINKQPAFDHPLLKDHKLQRKPSFEKSFEKKSVRDSSVRSIFGLEKKDQCPSGTVPIRRTTKDDLIRNTLLNNHVITQDTPGTHRAEVYVRYGPYYKVSGKNSIYNPKVFNNNSNTISHLWVQNGQADTYNTITFGWHVAPQLYGDGATYVHATWTSDNFKKTGCYNLLCPGFVQTHKGYYLGSFVPNPSIYGGDITEFTISIAQDQETKNWWLINKDVNIGYFPAALFSNMSSAEQVGWGGKTITPPGTANPQMGSGYFPDDNFVHACYFRFISVQNASRQDYGPVDYEAVPIKDNSGCFNVEYYGNQGGESGYALQFGGPGGFCGAII